MKNWFSVKLYIEGLKKIKVPGIACAIAVIALNTLLPIVGIIESSASWPGMVRSVSAVDVSAFAPFSLMMMVFAAILVHSMFSFLNERNRADFWHAIPQKRTCAYVSLTAAVYTWILGTIVAGALVNGILWGIAKYYSVSFSVIAVSTLVYFLAAIMIAGFMTLAMTITGTTISNLLILALLLLFTRVMGTLFTMGIKELTPMFDINYSFWKIFEFEFSLPYALIDDLFSNRTNAFGNLPLILYSIGVVVLLLVLGAVCYNKRKSEMATKSAPSKTMQHVYRSAITLPFAFFFAVLLTLEDMEPTTAIILIIVTVLVWLIFELMTTKKIKNAIKSLPLLIIPVLVSTLLCGGLFLVRGAIWNTTPDGEDIKGINIGAEAYWRKTYEQLKTENIIVKNEKLNNLISDILEKAVEDEKSDYRNYDNRTCNIVIHLKSGRTIGRNLRMSDKIYAEIRTGFYESVEYSEAKLSMPSTKEIEEILADSISLNKEEAHRLWASYLFEYSLLSDLQKQQLKESEKGGYWLESSLYTDADKVDSLKESRVESVGNIYVNGSINFEKFYSTYPIYYELMPQTAEMYLAIKCEQNLTLASSVEGELKEIKKLFDKNETSEKPILENGSIEFSVLHGDTACNFYFYQNEDPERLSKILDLLADLSAPADYSPQSGKTILNVSLNVETEGAFLNELDVFEDSYFEDGVYYYHHLRFPIALTAAETKQLKEICIEETPKSDK